jgi:hypothetical protein
MPHVQNSLAGFADDSKSFRQEIFDWFCVFEALFEFGCFRLELLVAQGRNSRL